MLATRLLSPLALLLALSACVGGDGPRRAEAVSPPSTRSRPPIGYVPSAPSSAQSNACLAQLRAAGVRFTALADQEFGGGCHARAAVRLEDIGTPTTNLGAMTCPLAQGFSAWLRYAVRPAARQVYGEELARVDTFGTYSCRNVAGSARLSEHARANAVDVSAFILTDGTRISVLDGWHGDERSQRFLRLIRASACRRFGTVLSPDYNAAHHNHFHFDMSGQAYCR